MNIVQHFVITPLVISALVAWAITPFVIRLVTKWGLIDDPKVNKHPKVVHTKPTARGGGLAIFIGILVASLILLPIDSHLLAILAGGALLVVLGLCDDKWDVSPYVRLVVQFIAAGIPVAAGIGISFVTNPINGIFDLSYPQITFFLFGEQRTIWLLSDLFAIGWLVFLMNILNMGAKGLPGQLSGITTIAALTIAALSVRYTADITEWSVIILAVITAGAYLGHLRWNMLPQRIMPSFGGSTLAGYMLGVLSILSTAKVGTLLVVLGIPMVDTAYAVLRRLANKKSPFWGDRGHLHHKLIDSGLSKTSVTVLYWTFTGILGVLALNLNASQKLYTIVGIILVIGGLLVWLRAKPLKS